MIQSKVKDYREGAICYPAECLPNIDSVHLKVRNEQKRCGDLDGTSKKCDHQNGVDASDATHLGMHQMPDHICVEKERIDLKKANFVRKCKSRVSAWKEYGCQRLCKENENEYKR